MATIEHMTDKDINHIDKRSYFITIPLSYVSETEVIQKAIYTKIRKSFGFKDNNNMIGLILCGDINGTRTGMADHLGYEHPHCHGLIFIPKDIAPQTAFTEQMMFKKLKSGLGELREIAQQVKKGTEIYIKRYQPVKSLFQTISYTIKADINFVSGNADKFNYSTFPYDDKLNYISRIIDFDNQRTQDLLFKFHLFPEQVFAMANLSHLTKWQLYHRQCYEDAVGEKAKNDLKKRFVQLLRPTANPLSPIARFVRRVTPDVNRARTNEVTA